MPLGLAREQNALGHVAHIWTLDSLDESNPASEWGLEQSLFTFPVLGPASIGFSLAAERAIRSRHTPAYDILHQHGIWMANSRLTCQWRAATGRPTIIAPHGTLEPYALRRSAWKKRLVALLYESNNLQSASCLHATAESEVVSFRDWGLRNPIAIIPNGVPEEWIRGKGDPCRFRIRHGISPEKRLLLFLSRLHPKKGLPLLLEAMARVEAELMEWSLIIAGPDEAGHQAELQAIIENLNLQNKVQFVGPLFGDDKRDAFAAADLFVLTTQSENFAIVVAEALASGLPVLTTHGAPWQELETNNCGWWIETNVNAIARALLEVRASVKSELVAMGQRGKDLVAKRYVWAASAQKSLELYTWLLGQNARPEYVIID